MRRFSQRNSLVTLNEINITPLLDLAFVLLIIFVITRPLLEQTVNLQLPENMGGPDNRHIDRSNIRVVEVNQFGAYYLNGRPCSFGQLESDLRSLRARNPHLIVDLRGDKRASWDKILAVMDVCMRDHIALTPRTAPLDHR